MDFKTKIESLTQKGCSIEERTTNVSQFVKYDLSEDVFESEYPETNHAPELFYDAADTEFILLDPQEDIICNGSLDEIKTYIESNF